uniref:Uncharacterized protein n=1 Tax=Ciona savignyi TaxID=51511 RepID=H2YQ01_CIOSA
MKISSKGVKIHGWAKLEVLSGSCLLNGFVLNVGDPPKLVSAPLSHVALSMCPVNAGTTESKTKTSAKYVDVLPEIEEILNSYEIVVLFQYQSNQTTQYPGYPDIFIVKTPEVNDFMMICKHCYLCSTERYFMEYKPYISSAEALLAYSK